MLPAADAAPLLFERADYATLLERATEATLMPIMPDAYYVAITLLPCYFAMPAMLIAAEIFALLLIRHCQLKAAVFLSLITD